MIRHDPSAPDGTRTARLALAALLTLLGLWIASRFLPALAWGAVLAIAVDPAHVRLRHRFAGRHAPTLIAAGITLAVALAVLIPIAAGLTQAAREAHDVAAWVASAQANGVPVPGWVPKLPFASDQAVRWWQENLATPGAAAERFHLLSGAAMISHTKLIGSDVLRRLVIFGFTLLTLFFVLRDRDPLLDQLRRGATRMFGATGQRIGTQAIRSVRGTIDGLVLVGIGEGAAMAVVYLALGVPHPLLLGALTAVAAMIPFGAALIFAIAALLLLGTGSAVAAVLVVAIGLVVVGIADHFVRPALIGGATRLPFLWVLIGILGGVETMGLIGLFVGPAVMAVLVMLWRDYLGEPVEA